MSFVILHSSTHKRHNTLYINTITAARAKFKNFKLKISLCAQLAVSSEKKCKYCAEAELRVMCCDGEMVRV